MATPIFPEPKQIEFSRLAIHDRYRVVIQQPSNDDARELAKALSVGNLADICVACSCDVERFAAYVNEESGEVLGEVVLGRWCHRVAADTPSGAAPPQPGE